MTEHERVFLGQVLLEPVILEECNLREEMFLSPAGRKIFRALRSIYDSGVEPDQLLVMDREPRISPSTLAELTSEIHTTANWGYYRDRIVSEYQNHALKALGEKLRNGLDPDSKLELAEKVIDEIRTEGGTDRVTNRSEGIADYISTLEERYNLQGALPGLPSGLKQLDNYLLGFQQERYYVIAGRPSSGKSALLLQAANHLAVRKDVPVGYISVESSKEELLDRSFASLARIPSQRIQTGLLVSRDFESILRWSDNIAKSPFQIFDTPNAELSQIQTAMRQMVRKGARIIFVDYLQLIRVRGTRDRREQVEQASLAMKTLSRQLKIPVVCAAQLGRDATGSKVPGLSDLQYSSQIEQDADAAALLHVEEDKDGHRYPWIIIAKNRDGECGRIPLNFQGSFLTFSEIPRNPVQSDLPGVAPAVAS